MTIETRIRQEIEDRIHSGEWRPGHRIPFEHELVARYGCARATVSKALGSLAKAGLIERRRKAGSFVAHPQVHSTVLEVPDLAQIVAARGESYRWVLGDQRMIDTIDDFETLADFPSPAFYIEGRHLGGGEPFAIERRWINSEAVPDVRHETFDAQAPGTWLLHHIPWTAARHAIRAVEADRDEAKALEVRHRAACLELWRTTWRSGRPITIVRQLFRGDRFDLVADFAQGNRR